MRDIPYYDYKKDFLNGNGWIVSEYRIIFKGEIIDSPNYIFKNGKYKDKSLQSIIELCWQGIIKYIDYGLIYITKKCLDAINCSKTKLTAVRVANDSKLRFCRIYDSNDELYSNPFPCTYQGELVRDVLNSDPLYFYELLKRALFHRYGVNQRFYATDQAFSLFGENVTLALGKLLKHLEIKKISGFYIDKISEMYDSFCADEERYREEMDALMREQMEKDLIKESYRAAFENDPEAEWNID